ncbi:MAG: alpha/beta hydrolase [Pseudomonadota bacterium]
MARQRSTDTDLSPPALRHSFFEAGKFALEFSSTAVLAPLLRRLPKGDGHSIMILPGFMGADGSTATLRRMLRQRGYNAIPWGLGRNAANVRSRDLDDFLAHRSAMEDRIGAMVEQEYIRSGGKLTLIGWSLGGLYAVALAHRYPNCLRQVITLGTPYGDPRGTALYSVMGNLYNREVDEEALERWVNHTYRAGDLQVPVLALYSETDGIVGPGIARCEADPRYVTNVAIPASHVGFPFNPLVFAVIANYLAPPEERWRVFNRGKLRCWMAPAPA